MLWRNLRWLAWPRPQRRRPSGNATVTVIVPARNEAADVARSLRSLLAQDYSRLRVIAVNDHSDDDTPRIMEEVAAAEPRLTVLHNPELRPGWLGKHNAMQTALDQIDSDLVLLTDADVEFDPACVSQAVADLEARGLDLLSIYPQFEFVSFCETMLLPIYVGGAALLLSPEVEDPRSPHAMAVGAFMLVRTGRLKEVGGFGRVKTSILDDVGLARVFKGSGLRVGLRSAPDLIRVRFFKDNRDAFFGAAKHLLGVVQNRLWLAPVLALLPAAMYGVLLFSAIYGALYGHFLLAGVALLTLAIHYASFLLSRPGNKFSAVIALAFPLMSLQFAASCLRGAYLLAAKGRFEWRGRRANLGPTPDDLRRVTGDNTGHQVPLKPANRGLLTERDTTAGTAADRTRNWLAAAGLIAPFLDVLITACLGALDPTYSHVRQLMSELGETGRPYAALFSAWCVLYGFLFAGFAVALARGLGGHRGSWLGPGALLVVAACSTLSAFFPCDPGCAGETTSARVHILVGEVVTVATVAAPFLAWLGMRRDERWRGLRVVTLAAGVLLAAVAGWLAVCHYAGLGRAASAMGAAQRLFLGTLYLWVGAVATRLWRLGRVAGRGARCGPTLEGAR
jgi:chlorobactene glucosyltransferase